mmetsp:Transcript_48138/g.117932  ORF Transcript_48138/g.117932 Transcript_48138/m.117932 type:complete len:250 (+) Transcript_48138:171-920(+)
MSHMYSTPMLASNSTTMMPTSSSLFCTMRSSMARSSFRDLLTLASTLCKRWSARSSASRWSPRSLRMPSPMRSDCSATRCVSVMRSVVSFTRCWSRSRRERWSACRCAHASAPPAPAMSSERPVLRTARSTSRRTRASELWCVVTRGCRFAVTLRRASASIDDSSRVASSRLRSASRTTSLRRSPCSAFMCFRLFCTERSATLKSASYDANCCAAAAAIGVRPPAAASRERASERRASRPRGVAASGSR